MKAEINISFSYNQILEVVKKMPQSFRKKLLDELFLDRLETFKSKLKGSDSDSITEDEILAETDKVREEIYASKKNKN